jgi:bifunctional enzyme CysN/CysC
MILSSSMSNRPRTMPPRSADREGMSIVIVGHVDHGKSTIIGRLLADTGSLPEGKLDQVRALCAKTDKPFEYAFLLDALKDEQAQGITIDAARVFFKTALRDYIIIDAPGHTEFLKNMITGAARAQAALLVIDAAEGARENSRRHGTMLSLLGIGQVAVLVNKMDLVRWEKGVFDAVVAEYGAFLERLGVKAAAFVPVSGRDGDNIATRSTSSGWYDGPTVLDVLDRFPAAQTSRDAPLRMAVQDIYKFTGGGDDRRIVSGTIASGAIHTGDEVVFYPSGKRSRVKSIERFNAPPTTEAVAGEATGFTLTEQIYVSRGEVAAIATEKPPHVTTRVVASIFWLGKAPLARNKEYLLKIGAARVPMRLEAVNAVMDAATLQTVQKDKVERHEVADCTLAFSKPAAVDLASEASETSRFVIVDDYEIRGGGIVRQALPDRETWLREKVFVRNAKWEASAVALERRVARYAQRPTLLIVSGDGPGDRRKALAREIELCLFDLGRLVYYVGIGNVLYGVDADLERTEQSRQEHMRRLAEVAHLMLDAGFILVVTAADLGSEDIAILRTVLPPESIETIWVGAERREGVTEIASVSPEEDLREAAQRVRTILQDIGILYRW